MFSRLFYAQLVALLMVAPLHIVALEHSLYWYFVWFDVLTHFLGGVWVVFSTYWLWHWWRGSEQRFSAIHAIAAVLAVGIGWEFFELMAGIPRENNFVFDTTLDLLMDTLGGMCAWVIARILMRHE